MCLKQNRKPLALKPGTSLAEKEAYSHDQFLPLQYRSQKKKKISRKQTSVEGVSSTLYNAVAQPLMSIEMSKAMLPALSSLNPKPQYVQLWNNLQNPEGVNTIFGTVPKGSALFYQLAPLVAQDLYSHIIIPDIPPPPRFDFPNLPQTLLLVLPFEQHNIYSGLCNTTDEALQIEEDTRVQSASAKWFQLRRPRLHHSGCFSLPKEEPLSTCLPQLPVSRNVTPGRSNILD